jgi:hypothetical protein
MATRRAAALVVALLLLAGCSDEEPPDWLVERASPSTATTAVPTTSAPPTTAATGPGQDVAVVDLAPGMCIEDASAFTGQEVNEITRASAIACRLPHQAEVYAADDLPAGPEAGFPGVGRLRTVAQELCRDRFQAFVGVPWTASALEIAALWPSPPSWAEGDRLVVCAVFRLDGQPMTGSAEGSAA